MNGDGTQHKKKKTTSNGRACRGRDASSESEERATAIPMPIHVTLKGIDFMTEICSCMCVCVWTRLLHGRRFCCSLFLFVFFCFEHFLLRLTCVHRSTSFLWVFVSQNATKQTGKTATAATKQFCGCLWGFLCCYRKRLAVAWGECRLVFEECSFFFSFAFIFRFNSASPHP